MKHSVLLVGGAGFLGNSLAKHLSTAGVRVFVADTRKRLERYAIRHQGVEHVEMEWPDTTKLAQIPKVNCVIHLAWTTNPASSMNNIIDDASTNILGTLNLLEHNITSSLDKFIFMSSGGTVYGDSNDDKLREDHSTNPISAYGISKLTCENYTQLYALNKKFDPIIVRLGNPYGNYQLQGTPTGVIANFVRKIDAGASVDVFGAGDTIRDYIHIDDVVTYLNLLLEKDSASGIYNLGSGVGVSVKEIINLIGRASGEPISINYMESRRADVHSVVLNMEKLQSEVAHKPQVSIREGIASMVLFQSELKRTIYPKNLTL